jgi:hypothetical protein
MLSFFLPIKRGYASANNVIQMTRNMHCFANEFDWNRGVISDEMFLHRSVAIPFTLITALFTEPGF